MTKEQKCITNEDRWQIADACCMRKYELCVTKVERYMMCDE